LVATTAAEEDEDEDEDEEEVTRTVEAFTKVSFPFVVWSDLSSSASLASTSSSSRFVRFAWRPSPSSFPLFVAGLLRGGIFKIYDNKEVLSICYRSIISILLFLHFLL
jgi:hypothetical protein